MTKWDRDQLCNYWRINYTTLGKWLRKNKDFPIYNKGRGKDNYFYKEEVEEYIQRKFNK